MAVLMQYDYSIQQRGASMSCLFNVMIPLLTAYVPHRDFIALIWTEGFEISYFLKRGYISSLISVKGVLHCECRRKQFLPVSRF